MDSILILDDNTINQISAGEVIERPSSIIKELVENSIDAQASAITIEIREGGISYIRITDNGKGMGPKDAKVSFLRHATSKIESSSDLDNVYTLGFRGEALASIASVTQMEMITREKNSISGIRIVNHGGNIISEREEGCPEGTTILTQNLFFNTPARLKFLKNPRIETAHISDMVSRFILAHPKVSFKYINNDKLIYHSSGDGNLKHAILSVYGLNIVDEIFALEQRIGLDDLSIWGFLGKPSLARKNRNHQSFFVNGRYIKSKFLEGCVEAAFDSYLTINLFPWVVLHMGINPDRIDVNVHPSKTEIRFREEKLVGNILEENIVKILEENPYIPQISKKSFLGFDENTRKEEDHKQIELIPPQYSSIKEYEAGENIYNIPSKRDFPIENQDEPAFVMPDSGIGGGGVGAGEILKVSGRLFETYIIVEGSKKCFLIDQHAAHERLIFEQYKEMFKKQAVLTQEILPPYIMEVTSFEENFVKEHMELFNSLGFEIEEFGGRSFAIRGVPMILGLSQPKEFFEELLVNIDDYKKGSGYKLKVDDIIRMSCKKAVKAGDKLSEIEALRLLKDILEKKIPLTCPHGRPIMISLEQTELEKMFKRIQ